jgi:hypothetical protein
MFTDDMGNHICGEGYKLKDNEVHPRDGGYRPKQGGSPDATQPREGTS